MKFNIFNHRLIIYTVVLTMAFLALKWCNFMPFSYAETDTQTVKCALVFIFSQCLFFELARVVQTPLGFLSALIITNIFCICLIHFVDSTKMSWMLGINCIFLIRLVRNLIKNNFSVDRSDLLTRV